MPQYIFIYNQTGVGPNSRDDLKELFTRYPIYSDSNVGLSDFNCNFDGLSPEHMTFVLPGGTVHNMGVSLRPIQGKLTSLFSKGSQGLFICAGAYLAAGDADVFCGKYTKRPDINEFLPLNHWINTTDQGLSLNILPEYKAFGSFIPNDSYLDYPKTSLSSVSLKPYLTSLFFPTTRCCSRELFIAGCGFEPLTEPSSAVATYTDKDRYSFFYSDRKITKAIKNMAAIVKKPGILASGVHLEACVENSKLLKLMTEGMSLPQNIVLPLPDDTPYDSESSRELLIPLIKDTLNPGCR